MADPVYVYGVARAGVDPSGLRGIDAGALEAVEEAGLAALVGRAPAGPVETTRDRLLAHARVLEELAARTTVLPMRFGVVAPSDEVLRRTVLDARRKVLASLLDELEGTVELDVRVLFEESSILQEIVRRSPDVGRLQLSIRNRPADATYYDRVRLGEAVAKAMGAIAEREEQRIASHLGRLALDVRRRDRTDTLTVLRAAFLLRRGDVDAFREAADGLGRDPRLHVRTTGPMPPYSFVEVGLRPARRGRRSWAS